MEKISNYMIKIEDIPDVLISLHYGVNILKNVYEQAYGFFTNSLFSSRPTKLKIENMYGFKPKEVRKVVKKKVSIRYRDPRVNVVMIPYTMPYPYVDIYTFDKKHEDIIAFMVFSIEYFTMLSNSILFYIEVASDLIENIRRWLKKEKQRYIDFRKLARSFFPLNHIWFSLYTLYDNSGLFPKEYINEKIYDSKVNEYYDYLVRENPEIIRDKNVKIEELIMEKMRDVPLKKVFGEYILLLDDRLYEFTDYYMKYIEEEYHRISFKKYMLLIMDEDEYKRIFGIINYLGFGYE